MYENLLKEYNDCDEYIKKYKDRQKQICSEFEKWAERNFKKLYEIVEPDFVDGIYFEFEDKYSPTKISDVRSIIGFSDEEKIKRFGSIDEIAYEFDVKTKKEKTAILDRLVIPDKYFLTDISENTKIIEMCSNLLAISKEKLELWKKETER